MVSVLYREPKLLKAVKLEWRAMIDVGFSALP